MRIGLGCFVVGVLTWPLALRAEDAPRDAWEKLGGAALAGADAQVSALHPVLAPAAEPLLAYSLLDPARYRPETHVRAWRGAAWSPVGAPIRGEEVTAATVDPAGRTLLCLAGKPAVYLLRGEAWERVGGDIAREAGHGKGRHLVLDCGGVAAGHDGAPTVVWSASTARRTQEVFSARWDATARRWRALGGKLPQGRLTAASLARAPDGALVLVASALSDAHVGTTRVYRASAQGWTQLGGDLRDTYGAAASTRGAELVVAAESTKVPRAGLAFVASWRDGRWLPMPSPGPAAAIRLARSPSGKLVSVRMIRGIDVLQVSVFEQGAWRDMPALPLGASAADGQVTFDLSVDAGGHPVLAWTEDTLRGTQLLVWRARTALP